VSLADGLHFDVTCETQCQGWLITAHSFIPVLVPTMPKVKKGCHLPKHVTSNVQKKLALHSELGSGPTSALELIDMHLQSTSTQRNYSSAITNAKKWLEENWVKYSNPPLSSPLEGEDPNPEACLFQHKDAPFAFDKPVEITAKLLAAYITFRATDQNKSVSTVDILRSAFKWHFRKL
jgi:hypothetical protein